MKRFVCLLASLLLLLSAVSPTVLADDLFVQDRNGNESHPWGGDEGGGGDNPGGDSINPERASLPISLTGYTFVDLLIHHFIYQRAFQLQETERFDRKVTRGHRLDYATRKALRKGNDLGL